MQNKYKEDLRKLLSFYVAMLKKYSFPEAARIKTFVEDDRDERTVRVMFRYTALLQDHTSLEDCQEGVRFFRAIAKEEKSFLRKVSLRVKPIRVSKSERDSFEAEERECLIPKHAFSAPLLRERMELVTRLDTLKQIDDAVERVGQTFSENGILYSLRELRKLLDLPALCRRVRPATLRRDIYQFEKRALKEIGLNGSSYNLI